ncbi:MAG: putative 3-hydroxyacyl-CoA dehydrogenase [Fimbriimonadaceae bacterium]|nr:putative 3-hydroxyacyl-CoA dehydrogenase [Fimbriimonadaceae bacterium]
MGSGIAAHLANIGFQVSLLDRSAGAAQEAFDRAKKAKPPHFMVPETAGQVRLGSIEHDLHWIKNAHWVCEAIFEDMRAKKELYALIEDQLAPDAMISTNTSGLEISLLAEGRTDSFRRRFHGTHFFNPPRYLKLLELIPTPETDPAVIQQMVEFLEGPVARRVVVAKDTPGFIANRYGMWSMIHTVHVAEKLQLTCEEVDAITGSFLGRPRTGSFRLNDLVGIDIMKNIADNLYERCSHDPRRGDLKMPQSMEVLLERGWLGDKTGQGYYRREGKELMAIDLQTFAYRQRREPELPTLTELAKVPLGERIRTALERKDPVGEFLREQLVPSLKYANAIKEEISHSVEDFDRVMKWGFGWEAGPFEMIDAIGAQNLGMLETAFYEGGTQRSWNGDYVERAKEPQFANIAEHYLLDQHETFNLRDLGDGVTAVALTTKMGVLSPRAIQELTSFFDTFDGRAVLTSEARSFSAGFDLTFVLTQAEADDWQTLDNALYDLQMLSQLLSEKRVVAAVFGHCLGAGLEVALGCPQIIAAAETQIGLPEARVGLIPSGSGCARMHLRHQGSAKELAEAIIRLTLGTVAGNADEARKLGYLRVGDVTQYHPDRMLFDAKLLAETVEPLPQVAWINPEGPLVGMVDRAQEELKARGELSEFDEIIGDKLKMVCGKAQSYEQALGLERQEFEELCRQPLTHARIKHMLETGKPLKN